MAYSYEDFENAANQAGLLGQFSQYDMELARAHPEAGLSILSLKKDYANATTPEQRALINEAANQVRSSYGSYTGGTDGSRYYAVTPQTQTSGIDRQVGDVMGQIGSFGSFAYENDDTYKRALEAVASAPAFEYDKEAPTYVNAWEQQQRDLLDKIVNREQFSYDKDTDPVYGSYKKSYLREGDRATANALAQASAASGGRASSYAVNAATQAGDYYATKLSDIIPTLYQQAFDRYLQEYQMKLSDLNAVNGQEQLDYQKYLNDLGQFNTDRSFALDAYDAATQARLNALNALSADRQMAYGEWSDQYTMLQNYLKNLQGQSDTIYARALDDENRRLSQEQQSFENQLALATYAAELGDYSLLEAMGIGPNTENVYQRALAAAGRLTPVGGGGTGGGTGAGGAGGTGAGNGSGNGGGTGGGTGAGGAGGTGAGSEGAAGAGLTAQAYNMAARGILENWQNGKADAARQGIADIWNSLSPEQQANLRNTLTNNGAGALFSSGNTNGNGYIPMGDLNRESNHSGAGGLEINLESVEGLGYGPISADRLAELVQQGLVEEYVKDGQRHFRRVQQVPAQPNNR